MATSLLCGLGFLVFAVLRLGVLVRYRSKAVLIGDIGGLVTSALASQAARMLRLEVDGSQRWISIVADSARQLPHAHAASLAVRHRHGRAHGGHPALLAVRAGRPGGAGDRHRAGRNTGFRDGVAVVGHIESGPPRVGVPHLGLTEWLRLIPLALAICALARAEGLLLARRYARRHHGDEDPDQDSAALGLANLAGGVTLAMPVGSSSWWARRSGWWRWCRSSAFPR